MASLPLLACTVTPQRPPAQLPVELFGPTALWLHGGLGYSRTRGSNPPISINLAAGIGVTYQRGAILLAVLNRHIAAPSHSP